MSSALFIKVSMPEENNEQNIQVRHLNCDNSTDIV